MKRIFLFVLTNIAVVAVLGIIASLLGVNRFLTANGLNLQMLLGFALVIGFGGAIISLLISKPVAKWSSGVRVINDAQNADEAWIVETVRKLADKAQIGMPEVGIFEGAPNAFATGAFKNSSLVAVSTGLLQGMTKEEIEAVIGHEIAHVATWSP
jgi:heat shock protein HtpX